MFRGLRNDGQLWAAEKSPVALSVLHQHSQPQLNAVSEVTDKDSWVWKWNSGWKVESEVTSSSRACWNHPGLPMERWASWDGKLKEHLFWSSATAHTLSNVGSTAWLYTAGEVSSRQACSLVTHIFWPRVIPWLVSSNWHWNAKLTYFSQMLFKLWLFCRKFYKIENYRVQLVYFWMLD